MRTAARLKHALRAPGRFRNWPSVVRSLLASRPVSEVVMRSGHRIRGSETTTLLRLVQEIWIRKKYNPPGFELRAGADVVDIGGNVGVFSLFAAASGARRVAAIEPHPENASFIRQNADMNGFDSIDVVEAAASAAVGEADLFVGPISGGHMLRPESTSGYLTQRVRVATTTLPAVLEERAIDHVDFLKLDCEGAEGRILDATPDSVLRRVERIALEYHDNASSLAHPQLAERLRSCGFDVRATGGSPFGYLYARRP